MVNDGGKPPASGGKSGIPVDASGRPTVDPTKNVLDLVAAAISRQDDLRDLEIKRLDALREIQVIRIDSLREAESKLQHTINDFQIRLTMAETRRIDDLAVLRQTYDVRAADNLSVQVKTTSDLISTQLDKQTGALSQQIRDGNDAFTGQIRSITESLGARIADLEKFRWEVGGRTSVTDPAALQTAAALAKLTGTKEEGRSSVWAAIISIIVATASVAGVIGFIIAQTNGG